MKRIILFGIILSFLFVLMGCDLNKPEKDEWNTKIVQYRVGEEFYIKDITDITYRISYENEYTVTFVFSHPTRWIWIYITIDKNNNRITIIRSNYQRPY